MQKEKPSPGAATSEKGKDYIYKHIVAWETEEVKRCAYERQNVGFRKART